MADEQTATPDTRGLPEGVSPDNVSATAVRGGDGVPTAPVINNQAPAAKTKDDVAEDDALNETFVDPNAPKDEPKPDDAADDKADENKDDKAEDEPNTEYVSYDDPAADGIVAILKEANVDVKVSDEIFREAAETGDLTKINKEKLVELVGEAKANMVMLAAQDYYTRTMGVVQESVTAVHEAVGGEAAWQALQKWAAAKQEKDPAFKKQCEDYNRMFDLNKTSAVMAAKALREAYNADPKNKSLTTNITQGNKSGSVQVDEPLSRADYVTQLKAAYDKNDMAEVNRLNALRAATRNQTN